MVHPDEEPDHSHSHNTRSCDTIAGKRREYIEAHLDAVKEECAGYEACVTSIMSDNSALVIIEGGDLELRTVCSPLIRRDNNGKPIFFRRKNPYRGRGNSSSTEPRITTMANVEENASCPLEARITIRRDINKHVTEAIDTRDIHPEWQAVWNCLERDEFEEPEYKEAPPFQRVCNLALTNRTVCNRTVHKTLENFFTRQLEHLQCVCQALPGSASAPVGLIAGLSAGGVLLLLLLLILLIYCCYFRPKQRKRKATKRNNTSLDSWGPPFYNAGASERQDSVYSEIDEGSAGRGRVLLAGKGKSGRPPTLPQRYTQDPTRQPPVGADGYLEAGASAGSGIHPSGSAKANLSGSVEVDYLLEKPTSFEHGDRGLSEEDEYLHLMPDSPPPPPPEVRRGDGGEGYAGDYFILERDSKSGLPCSPGLETKQQEQLQDEKEKKQQQQEEHQEQQQEKQQEKQQHKEQEEKLQQQPEPEKAGDAGEGGDTNTSQPGSSFMKAEEAGTKDRGADPGVRS